jgi:Arc/MetJ-type ribon-helix-helix transcriptional regulator
MKKKMDKFSEIRIPTPLFEKIVEKIKDTGFSSVESYVTYVLREILAEDEQPEKAFTKEDEEKVKARLRDLGYMD